MSTLCPKSFSIAVASPSVPPIAYYKLNVQGGGNSAIDSIAGRDTLTNTNVVTVVPGKITNAFRWGNNALRRRALVPGDPFDFHAHDFTFRVWIRLNTFPLTGAVQIGVLGLAFFVVGGGGFPPTWHNETPGWYWNVFGQPVVWGTAISDQLWHRVVFWYNAALNRMGVRVDDGVDSTLDWGGVPNSYNRVEFDGGNVDEFESCEAGVWDQLWLPAQYTSDWNGGAGVTYP